MVGADGLARPVWATSSPLMQDYYDHEWGIPVTTEQGIFERITLEGFQSGLSWATILNKRAAFREVFAGFDPQVVAGFGENEVAALLQDARIVRHRGKIRSTINNAQATLRLREQEGLAELVWSFRPATTPAPVRQKDVPTQSPESLALSKALRGHGFSFVGPTTMFALMEAIGLIDTNLLGAHRRGCSGLWPQP